MKQAVVKVRGDRAVVEARVNALFATTPIAATMSFLGSIIVASAFWDPATRGDSLAFIALAALLLIVRVALLIAYRRSVQPRTIAWAWAMTGFTAISGVVWGAAVFWAVHFGSDRQVLVISCIALGAVMMTVTNIAFWPAYLVFQLPVIGIAAVSFATSGRPGHLQIGVASAILCVTMAVAVRKLGGSVVGSMRLAAENADLARRLCEHASALEQANRELEILSRTDGVTGLANRRWFVAAVEREWARAHRMGTSLALLTIDVDHFKQYNDQHGHAAGDACLKVVAAVLEAGTRDGVDLAARPGGEEFALLLPASDLDTAMIVAERIRQAVIATTESPRSGLPQSATISIGVASSRPADGGRPESLLESADRALYRAKTMGRNRASSTARPAPAPHS
jgi:diguanylate cyclase (GGDEF)-like protein